MPLKHNIKEYNFTNSYIRDWNYYSGLRLTDKNGLMIHGTFSCQTSGELPVAGPAGESDTSEYHYFSLQFNNIYEGEEILAEHDFSGGTILSIEVRENGEENAVSLVVATDSEYTITFKCRKVSGVSLLKYLGFSYKNVLCWKNAG